MFEIDTAISYRLRMLSLLTISCVILWQWLLILWPLSHAMYCMSPLRQFEWPHYLTDCIGNAVAVCASWPCDDFQFIELSVDILILRRYLIWRNHNVELRWVFRGPCACPLIWGKTVNPLSVKAMAPRVGASAGVMNDWRKVRGVVGAELGPAVMMLT